MSLTPLTDRQQTLIINNVLAACKDIEKLNKTGYKFLYLCSGFIAHYDLYGFKSYYAGKGHNWLIHDILDNSSANLWRNFRPGDKDYEYYSAKAEVYKKLVDELRVFA
jgi:hypothetical protein